MIRYTKLKSTNRNDLKDVLPLSKPFTLLIEPSNLCNFKCIQCFQSIKTDSYFLKNRMNMPLARFKRIIEQLKEWKGVKLKVIKLSLYGEPLINPDFCEMLKISREADIAERIETTTNASLLNHNIAENLVRYQLDYVRVSIYALDQKKHQVVTNSDIDIHAIQENLQILKDIKKREKSERPFVSCKMLDSYSDQNEKFIQMYQDVADEVYIEKPHNWIKVDGVDFMGDYYKNEINDALKDCRQISSQRIACPMVFTTMAVRSNGDVAPCCVDFIGGTNLGSVDKSSLQEIWNSEQWFEFQKIQLQNRKHENYSCARCDIYKNDYYTRDNIDGFPVEKLR